MAWGGVAQIEAVADDLVRIVGLTLGEAASGTISLFGGGGEVELPERFSVNAVGYDGVDLTSAIEVVWNQYDVAATMPPLWHIKTSSPFLITFTNGGGDLATPELYIRYH
jgi:hypothetical protein